ncbi:MAG: hypothetical protein J7507_11290 [Pseudoxanthomonas sp.]|nr:hypothetical protein [Pseudoxanthomonas sp.]
MKAFSRVILVLLVLFSALHAFDFITNGQKLQSALASLGFGLMAYGSWCEERRGGTDDAPAVRDRRARGVSMLGMVLVTAYFVLRFTGP